MMMHPTRTGFLLSLVLSCAVGFTPVRADPAPTTEQLLAASLDMADLKASGVAGDWSGVTPDVTSMLSADRRRTALGFVVTGAFAWVGKADGADLESAVNVFPDPAAAARDYQDRRAQDTMLYGAETGKIRVGDESRLLERGPGKGQDSVRTLRWRHGRYLVRLTSSAAAGQPVAATHLERLAQRIDARLGALERGELSAPALPPLAASLPSGTDAARPLATYAGPSDWWVWEDKAGQDAASPTLRAILRKGVGEATAVARAFSVDKLADHFATVTIMPFRDRTAASRYLDASGLAKKAGSQGAGYAVQQPGGSRSVWRADAVKGRYVVETDCRAVDGPGARDCEAIVRSLTDATLQRLPTDG